MNPLKTSLSVSKNIEHLYKEVLLDISRSTEYGHLTKLNDGRFEYHEFKTETLKSVTASNKKMLIIGDSLTLQRPKPVPLTTEQTWPYLLHICSDYDVYLLSAYGATTGYCLVAMLPWLEQQAMCKFDLCILQLGLVDCALRPFSIKEEHGLRKRGISVGNHERYQLREQRKIQFCNTVQFKQNLDAIKARLNSLCKEQFLIEIFPASGELLTQSPHHNQQRDIYNEIIKETFHDNSIFFDIDPDKQLMTDGQHLNQAGSEALCNLIKRTVLK